MLFLGYLFDILPLPFTILQFSIDLGSGHTPSVCGLYGMAGGGVALPVGLLTIFQQIKAQATRLDLLWSQPVGPDGDGSNPNWCRVKPSHLARKKRLNSLGISQVWSRISAEVSIFLPGMNKVSGLKIPPLLVYNWLEILAQESPEPGTLTEYMSGW